MPRRLIRDFRSRSHMRFWSPTNRRQRPSFCVMAPSRSHSATQCGKKYKIGESLKIIDPETKSPAIKNPFLRPKPGVLLADDFAIDRLLERGVVFGACNMALQVQSKMLAGNAGVTAEEAAKEWAANVIPGITIIPSGTWGVNRAQEAGCTYCAGG